MNRYGRLDFKYSVASGPNLYMAVFAAIENTDALISLKSNIRGRGYPPITAINDPPIGVNSRGVSMAMPTKPYRFHFGKLTKSLRQKPCLNVRLFQD